MDTQDLARPDQPAGYWTGAAHEAIIKFIGAEQGKLGVTQRHWMTFNALDRSADGLTREALTEALAPYMTPQIGSPDTYPSVLDDLTARAYVEMDSGGVLLLTAAGQQKRADVLALSEDIRSTVHTGIDDDDYVTALTVLQRMIANVTD